MQQDFGFNQRDLGRGASETILDPAVMVAVVLTITLILFRPRKYIIIPLLMSIFLIPRGQQIFIGGFHWYVKLIIVLVGFVRLAAGKFLIAGGVNAIDKLFVVWATYRVLAMILTNGPNVWPEQASFWIQALCGYFLLRYLIQDENDITRACKALAVVAAILGLFMLIEHLQNVNLFGYLGGAPLFPEMRNGSIRAQATLGHAILAGCFGATLMPLFFWLWKSKCKPLAILGLAGSTVMVLASRSSTPMLAYAAGLGALFLWPIRGYMRAVRWGIVFTLAILALVMKAPVWFLIARVDVVGGSGGYERALLVDMFIRHITDWWFIGTNENGNWGWDMWDLSNQFVAEGQMGGMLTLVCFIAMVYHSYSRLGKMRRRVDRKQQWLFWCLGAVMLSHNFAYFGVAYWDQTQIWWFAFLAMISAATLPLDRTCLRSPVDADGGAGPEPRNASLVPPVRLNRIEPVLDDKVS